MFLLGVLAARLNLEFRGDPERKITGLASLASAGPAQLSFISTGKYLPQLLQASAGAVIVSLELADQCPVDYLISDDPYRSFALASQLFDNAPKPGPGIHASATVSPESEVHPSAALGPNTVIESGAYIGPNVILDAGVYIGRDSRVGEGSRIFPGTVLYHDVYIGENCLIQGQAVLGSDGFGYAPGVTGWEKICQLGGVRVGDRVEIGAGATIDRGALEHTIIEDGVIIDNQVHIAHNCSIGKNTAIAACCAVAGSTKIGANCTFGGMVGVAGHIEICDNAHFNGKTMVTKSVSEPGSYSSGTALMRSQDWRKSAVRFSQLDSMHRRLTALEKK
ncbi:MAG: UDP-3-O-(3-hydroxymyristoyl)glucosamine N-acyltransferase [Halioglobus sp.]